jgi:putative ABC transport system permease protein
MAVVEGRHDLGEPAGAVERALVNERAARQFWRSTAVTGRRFSLEEGPSTSPATGLALAISGVVRDDGSEPRVFRRLADADLTSANILVRTARPSVTIVEPLRALLLRLSDDRAFTRVSTYREGGVGSLLRMTRLALIVAGLVLSLAAIGLYGSISFMTSQRTREVAIRLALGSPRPAVLRLLAWDGILVVAGGSVLGLALTAVGFQFMSGMIFARWTLDPITVAGVLVAFSLTTLGACYLPGRRALRIDPMSVLRSD